MGIRVLSREPWTDESGSNVTDDQPRRPVAWTSVARGVVGILLFLTAIRFLGASTAAVSDSLARVVTSMADRPLSALGLGWVSTYILTNGSVVAALGVTIAAVGAADPTLTVALVSGSRLGAAAFVVMVGLLDRLRRGGSLRSKLELGILAFVVSHALYLPATALTWLGLPTVGPPLRRWIARIDPGILQPALIDSVAGGLIQIMGPLAVAITSVFGLFAGVVLFDRALRGVDLEALRAKIAMDRRWLAFLAGLTLTTVTSSVAFSIGVLVPLFNRRGITRNEITPYVLGANVTTLVDTFVVALVLRSWDAGAAVLGLMVAAFGLSLVYMIAYPRFFRPLDELLDTVSKSRAAFLILALSLLLAPVLLVFAGGWPR